MLGVKEKTYHFLEGGGEMGNLVRKLNWSETPLGPVSQWPQSLRTMVGVILHAETPMLLWWGDELIQFYNDAYRPSLGASGKHPKALAQRGEECWPEIWPIIKPLIDRVRSGGSIWSQDRLLPIFRNGRIEDVYWTFGYSPVRDESDAIAGVLVVSQETTEQINARKEIEESEKRLRSIILHAPVGICIINGENYSVEVVNDLYLKMVGKTRAQFEGKSLWETIPEARAQYAGVLDEVVRTGKSYEEKEAKTILLQGGKEKIMFVDFACELIRGNKNPVQIMILAIDVTDKVLARKKIEESEQRYKTLITESTVAIALFVGTDLRLQYVNQLMMGYWGRDARIIGKPLCDAIPELQQQPFLHKLTEVFTTGQVYVGTEEEAALMVNGERQPSYFNYILKPLRDADGEVYGVHYMAIDVTEQVLIRKKVEQSEANLRNIIHKAPVAMCILKGPRFIVEIANDKMFALWGKDRSKLLHKPILDELPEVREQFKEILTGVFNTGKTYSAFAIPTPLPRKNGVETVYINFVYEPLRNPEGVISGIMAVAIDVTYQVKARHKVEDLISARTIELKESNRSLQRSNDELAQFAYIASHDLQEPARKINTFIEMLQKALKDPDARSQKLLDKIDDAATRMLSLIRDILTYSRLAKEEQQFQTIDLNEVLASVLNDFELLIEEKGAVISSDPLPAIKGIPVQLNQLFSNLISNALKFTRKGVTPNITVKCVLLTEGENKHLKDLKYEHAYYKISFGDNGIGFNQDNAHQIFDIFQRLHARSDYEGTGIGLAMCKKITQNHNGDIYAESIENHGATFHVYLPAE